jgi:hypothetical protein
MSPKFSDGDVRAWLAVLLGILAAWYCRVAGGESAAPDALRVGLARVCITPEKPLWLQDATIVAEGGYEARGLVADIGFYSADAEQVLVQAVADLATGSDAIAPGVQRELDAGLFPGAVVLVGRPGKVLYHDAFDMPIRQALPELSGSGIEPITVTQLATHTSGFDNTKYHERAQGDAQLQLMLGASPKWPPGSRYYYSCQNLILLGRMVEKASGERLDAFCRSRIFQPLGMRDTSFGPLPPSSRVVPSGASEIGQIEDAQARLAGRPVGNAGLFSTAADLARFCEMMLGEGRLGEIRVLSPESHRLMTRNLLAPPLPARGFGWELDVNALHRPRRLSKRAYGHSGHTGQSIWIDPEKQVYLIVLTNRNHPKFVGGARKDEQYRARARIGDAALASLGY